MLRVSFVATIVGLALPAAAVAQTTSTDELIRTLLARIDALEHRVNELESSHAVASSAMASTSVAAPVEHEHVSVANAPSHEEHDAPIPSSVGDGIRVRGFADVGFTSEKVGKQVNSFGLGQLDLFVTSRISNKLSFLAEAVFEHESDNSTGIDLERMLLQYRHNEYLNVDIGRYHGSIGYYNSAYHHGSWLQTAVGRPWIFQFEDNGGPLPIHNVGVSVNGRLPWQAAGLRYSIEVGNGRNYLPNSDPVQNLFDNNLAKAVNVALSISPRSAPGWKFGTSIYRDRAAVIGGKTVGQNIGAAYAVYDRAGTEFLNEVVWMRHTVGGMTTSLPAFYHQVSRRYGAARPYARYEWANVTGRDPVAGSMGTTPGVHQQVLGGIRYDFSEYLAFKIQAGRREEQGSWSPSGAAQLSFTF